MEWAEEWAGEEAGERPGKIPRVKVSQIVREAAAEVTSRREKLFCHSY